MHNHLFYSLIYARVFVCLLMCVWLHVCECVVWGGQRTTLHVILRNTGCLLWTSYWSGAPQFQGSPVSLPFPWARIACGYWRWNSSPHACEASPLQTKPSPSLCTTIVHGILSHSPQCQPHHEHHYSSCGAAKWWGDSALFWSYHSTLMHVLYYWLKHPLWGAGRNGHYHLLGTQYSKH